MSIEQIKTFNNTLLSVLDTAPVNEGGHVSETFKNSVALAQAVEKWGFNRYWFAEHHNMPGIASSATSILIGHVAAATKRMRIGAGGIMLPNHAPLVIAEQFGTLEALYPGRIDLGLGRAPGSDQATAYALRRSLQSNGEDFPEQLAELEAYFEGSPTARVRAIPGEGQEIPIWLLGSSGFSAQLAAKKGLPFSFASHFAPAYTLQALQLYYQNFKPSKNLQAPYTMLGINVIAANTDEEAELLATSLKVQFLNISKGIATQLQPPVDNLEAIYSPYELAALERTLDPFATIIGSPETVRRELERLIKETKVNELIITSQIYNQADRLRSYEIIADMMV